MAVPLYIDNLLFSKEYNVMGIISRYIIIIK